jgi:hypothetical protein
LVVGILPVGRGCDNISIAQKTHYIGFTHFRSSSWKQFRP